MINITQVYGMVRSWLGEFFATEANSDQDIVDDIQNAVNYICSQRDWEFLDLFQTVNYTVAWQEQSIQEVVSVVSVYKDSNTDESPVYNIRTWKQSGDDGVLISWTTFKAKQTGIFEIVYQGVSPTITKETNLNFPSDFLTILVQLGMYFWMIRNQKTEDTDQILTLATQMMGWFANRHTTPNVTKKTGIIRMWSGHSF